MMAEFYLAALTLQKTLFEGNVRQVFVRTGCGDMSVLAGHASLAAVLLPGEIIITAPSGERITLLLKGGIIFVGEWGTRIFCF